VSTCLRILNSGVIVAALVTSISANATTITPTQSIGAIPAAPGTGLAATYTSLGSPPATLPAAALAASAALAVSATYVARTICFPACGATEKDGNTLASYTAANGVGLEGGAVLGPSYSTYSGSLAISVPGTYLYTLTSDDGSELTIGGVAIIDMPSQQTWTGINASVTFAAAGLYPIDIT
jgi:PA14 domain